MAFTSDRLFIVRVDDGKAKASYPLKSVQLAPSDKVNPVSAWEGRHTITHARIYRAAFRPP